MILSMFFILNIIIDYIYTILLDNIHITRIYLVLITIDLLRYICYTII